MHTQDDFFAYDPTTTLSDVKGWVDAFAEARDWGIYHRPKNLAMSVAIEAAELMEHFQWSDPGAADLTPEEKLAIGEEIADVLSYLVRLSSVLGLDLAHTLQNKMVKNAVKYPISGPSSGI